MHTLSLHFQTESGAPIGRDTPIGQAVIAGWTGRDAAGVEKHIKELEALGVKRPARTPVFYRVSASRLTTAAAIEVLGTQSSGEVEFVLLQSGGRLWVGAGSDHTDREAETYNVGISKEMCDKPVAPLFWDFEDVASHWDQLILRSYAYRNGTAHLYQEGPVAAMLHPRDLLARFSQDGTLASAIDAATLMFCGTLPVKGGISGADRFEFELEDRVRGCKISHAYDIVALPVSG